MKVIPIKPFEAEPWLLHKHYARRMPSISYAFGLYEDGNLVGVCTYGMPASNFLCNGVCGEKHRDKVIELNRLCVETNTKNASSFLVGNSLKMLPKPKIVVSYADTAQNHVGYVYQATNFLFTGTTKERLDSIHEDGKHARHGGGGKMKSIRSQKHRYVFFVGDKSQRKEFLKDLRFDIESYPKGESLRYDTGENVKTQGMLFV